MDLVGERQAFCKISCCAEHAVFAVQVLKPFSEFLGLLYKFFMFLWGHVGILLWAMAMASEFRSIPIHRLPRWCAAAIVVPLPQ